MNILHLTLAIVLAQSAGFIGSFFTRRNIATWYNGLKKPSLTPPNWLFAPVWFTLYTLMGVASYLIWELNPHTSTVQVALGLYTAQLVLNVLWSFVFFGMHQLSWGFLTITLLWLSIIMTLTSFLMLNLWAGLLFIPYLLWVTYAARLNWATWRLNMTHQVTHTKSN